MTKLKPIWGRHLRFEVVTRMRESLQAANATLYTDQRSLWLARARAFDEVYTELKGQGIGKE